MNNQWFYEESLLHMLYMYQEISTSNLENLFNQHHGQKINNIISNRHEKTNYIYKGYLRYDGKNRTVSITAKGKSFIEERYQGQRTY